MRRPRQKQSQELVGFELFAQLKFGAEGLGFREGVWDESIGFREDKSLGNLGVWDKSIGRKVSGEFQRGGHPCLCHPLPRVFIAINGCRFTRDLATQSLTCMDRQT